MLLTQTEMIYARGVKDLLRNPRYYLNTSASDCPTPPPPQAYPPFEQELDLERGLVTVTR